MHEWHDKGLTTSSSSSNVATAQTASSGPPRPAALTRFLAATDVDHALSAAKLFAHEYGSPQYAASLRHLVEHEWHSNPQRVYNVLQHSYLLPADIRFATLQKALLEGDDTQYRLAAAVGVQFTPQKFYDHAPKAELAFRQILLQYSGSQPRSSQPSRSQPSQLPSAEPPARLARRLTCSLSLISLCRDCAAEHELDDFLAARSFLAIKDRLTHPRDTKFVLALMVRLMRCPRTVDRTAHCCCRALCHALIFSSLCAVCCPSAQEGLTWRNGATWLLQHASTAERPLTADRLRAMITEAIEADRAAAAGTAAATAASPSDPTAAEWTSEWSQRLQSLDVDVILRTAGAALTDHWQRVGARQFSRLSRYQEIDIPAYAPLQMGNAADSAPAALRLQTGAPAQQQQQQQAPAAPTASDSRPHAPPRVDPQAAFQPDAILKGVLE